MVLFPGKVWPPCTVWAAGRKKVEHGRCMLRMFLKNIWTQVHPSIGKDLSISFPLEKSVYQLIEAMFTT